MFFGDSKMNDIKVGDVVKLKSGEEKMTVENIEEDNVICVWLDKEQALRREKIKIETIKLYEGGVKSVKIMR